MSSKENKSITFGPKISKEEWDSLENNRAYGEKSHDFSRPIVPPIEFPRKWTPERGTEPNKAETNE